MVPVPASYLDHKNQFWKTFWNFFLPFYLVSCFIRKKFINFNKFIVKCEWKNNLNEGNQIPTFIYIYSSGPGTVINYGSDSDFLTSCGSGSTSEKVTDPTVPVPVPQRCLGVHFGVVAPQRTPPGGGGTPALPVEVGVVLHTLTATLLFALGISKTCSTAGNVQ